MAVVACRISVTTVDCDVSTGLALCSSALQRISMTGTGAVVYCINRTGTGAVVDSRVSG